MCGLSWAGTAWGVLGWPGTAWGGLGGPAEDAEAGQRRAVAVGDPAHRHVLQRLRVAHDEHGLLAAVGRGRRRAVIRDEWRLHEWTEELLLLWRRNGSPARCVDECLAREAPRRLASRPPALPRAAVPTHAVHVVGIKWTRAWECRAYGSLAPTRDPEATPARASGARTTLQTSPQRGFQNWGHHDY